ncbi:hypothetical protein [uncultured Campylobacter sp.]|uniref:hypothetical protein n=1 Tax=uncultured Campylobacter sp. TaxID=218934 RepID=UPI00261F129E|nr:hypothetical protein [uncultured Campylobacter sp.]
MCFELPLFFEKLLYFEIPFYFEIPPCFETLPHRPEILHGGILSFKFYRLSVLLCAYRLNIYKILSHNL